MNIKNDLGKFILDELAIDLNEEKEKIASDEDLIINGLIDSMGIIKLIGYIERKFKIKLTYADITLDNFRNLDLMEKLISSKQKL